MAASPPRRFCPGPGLERLHAARRAALGHPLEARTAAEITAAGLAKPGDEREALALLLAHRSPGSPGTWPSLSSRAAA